ncbi:MAG TPA: sigma-70 family RNA polymerase sigma factor [Dehalococcoidia bacterium]|nr:sigma-70 family RNA polymerase sigma factor [Dehalococcoidia bacterium]
MTESLEDRNRIPAAAGTDERDDRSVVVAEWEIVRRAQSFDEDALKSLYETYYPKIYGYAFLQMGDVQAAEDLASDVMLKMIESIKSYQFKGLPFGAWMFRIARNRLIDLHRRRKRRGEVDLSETLAGTLASPLSMAERALERGQLQVAMKHLTDEQRQVIVLKFIQGFDNRSIGRIMGRSEGAIKSLQHRALHALRRVLYQGDF